MCLCNEKNEKIPSRRIHIDEKKTPNSSMMLLNLRVLGFNARNRNCFLERHP